VTTPDARTAAVEIVTLDRPERRNALDNTTCAAIVERMALTPPSERRCYLLHGAGDYFCSGADFDDISHGEDWLLEFMARVAEQPLPVIAWLNGPAYGAGAYLAAIADLRLVASGALVRITSARIGAGIPAGMIDQLRLAVGPGTAVRMAIGAAAVTSDELFALGLAERAESLEEALAYAQSIAELAPLVIQGARRGFQGRTYECDDYFRRAMASDDLKEGIAAFRERRSPSFQGR
jgi:enoyl-CoA hydratase